MGHFNEINLPMTEIVEEYLAGATANSLAIKHGVGCGTILKRLRKHGITTRKQAESYSVMSKEDRLAMTDAAHRAVRGKPVKESRKIKVANTVEANALTGKGISVLERRFTDWLLETVPDIDYTPQKAVHFYNVDIALNASRIAVEIFGGGWHAGGRAAKRYPSRIKHLLGAGWLPVIIWVTDVYPLTQLAVDHVISLHEVRRSDESEAAQEHVIWGTGELIPVDQRDPETGARVTRFKGHDKSRNHDGRFR